MEKQKLTATQEYNFYNNVFAHNKFIWGVVGALNLLKYKDACFFLIEPNSPPANVQGHNTSSTSIWVGWDTVPVADQNGTILSYTVTYKLVPDGSPQTAVVRAPTNQANLTGLTKYRKYSITVYASNLKGDGNASQPIIVMTDEDSKLSRGVTHVFVEVNIYE